MESCALHVASWCMLLLRQSLHSALHQLPRIPQCGSILHTSTVACRRRWEGTHDDFPSRASPAIKHSNLKRVVVQVYYKVAEANF